jgi:hypothetical protein
VPGRRGCESLSPRRRSASRTPCADRRQKAQNWSIARRPRPRGCQRKRTESAARSERYGCSGLLTLRDDSWPDLVDAGCGPTASDSAPGATAVLIRASPGPTETPQALACGGLTTGSPQTKRDYAAHGGTVTMMALQAR